MPLSSRVAFELHSSKRGEGGAEKRCRARRRATRSLRNGLQQSIGAWAHSIQDLSSKVAIHEHNFGRMASTDAPIARLPTHLRLKGGFRLQQHASGWLLPATRTSDKIGIAQQAVQRRSTVTDSTASSVPIAIAGPARHLRWLLRSTLEPEGAGPATSSATSRHCHPASKQASNCNCIRLYESRLFQPGCFPAGPVGSVRVVWWPIPSAGDRSSAEPDRLVLLLVHHSAAMQAMGCLREAIRRIHAHESERVTKRRHAESGGKAGSGQAAMEGTTESAPRKQLPVTKRLKMWCAADRLGCIAVAGHGIKGLLHGVLDQEQAGAATRCAGARKGGRQNSTCLSVTSRDPRLVSRWQGGGTWNRPIRSMREDRDSQGVVTQSKLVRILGIERLAGAVGVPVSSVKKGKGRRLRGKVGKAKKGKTRADNSGDSSIEGVARDSIGASRGW